MAARRMLLAPGLVLVAVLGLATPAVAGGSAPAGSAGHDISYPQCVGTSGTSAVGLRGQFGIVGVTDGLPWYANPCLAGEYGWAAGLPSAPGFYMNTANPAPHSSHYWPASGSSAPALCRDASSTTDPGCAYDYGWHTAAYALATATVATSGAASLPWWLDVESANSWNGNGSANAADLQGAVDYLRSHGAPAVGVYSSTADWSSITGGYTVITAAAYQAGWASEFVAQYPLSTSPAWVAGLAGASSAAATCDAPAFTGALPALAQYDDGSGFDADLVCGAGVTPPVAGPTPPAGPTGPAGHGPHHKR